MRTGMIKTKWLVAILALVAMMGVVACGGADEPGGSCRGPGD